MSPINNPGSILPQDTGSGDAVDDMITSQPISQNEIDDLLYGEDRPVRERVGRLSELAEELRARRAGDLAGDDSDALIDEIERAIASLGGRTGDVEDDDAEYGEDVGILAQDPEGHLEALSPDDEDAIAAIEGPDDEVDLDVLDDTEWDENDGFDPDKGVK